MLRRLLLSYLIIILVTIALLAVEVYLVTAHTFSRYLNEQVQAHNEMFPVMLAGYYTRYGTWDGVQADVEHTALMIGVPVVLADRDKNIVAASQKELIGQPLTACPFCFEEGAIAMSIKISENTTVGTIYMGQNTIRQRIDDQFLTNMSHALIAAGLLVAIFATGLAVWLAYSISRPLIEMSEAARLIAQGQIDVRVMEHQKDDSDEMMALARAFNQMAEGIGQVERLRRELVANVSHDLRTPLTVLRGYLEGLRTGKIADRRSAEMAFDAMHNETIHLLRLVDDLRKIAAFDAGTLPLERHPVAVSGLITDAIARITPIATAKGVYLTQEIPHELPSLNLDAQRLSQALFNLLENSVRHSPTGEKITLRAHHTLDQLTLIIHDHGEGISKEHLPHIFERFYRASPVRNRASGGSGLGLSIVQSIIRAHGGQITAHSDGLGQGSTFTIKLPID